MHIGPANVDDDQVTSNKDDDETNTGELPIPISDAVAASHADAAGTDSHTTMQVRLPLPLLQQAPLPALLISIGTTSRVHSEPSSTHPCLRAIHLRWPCIVQP